MKKKTSFPTTWTAAQHTKEVVRQFHKDFPSNQTIHHVKMAQYLEDVWNAAYKYGRADEHRLHFKNRRDEFMRVITKVLEEVKP